MKNKIQPSDLFIYRHRYLISYILIGIALVVAFIIAGIYIPGGLSSQERDSFVYSTNLSFKKLANFGAVNAPYYILQKICLDLFGVSQLTIKLPSLIIGFLAIMGIIILLRYWFSTNVAVLSSALIVTAGQFLYLAQNGTPDIMNIFYTIYLLLFATLIIKKKLFSTIWQLLFLMLAAFSLYTPLSIFPLIAMLVVVIVHPHLRFMVNYHVSKVFIAIGVILSGIILVPLFINILRNPTVTYTLIGFSKDSFNLLANFKQTAINYFAFFSSSNSKIITPFFGLSSFVIIIYGFYLTIKTHYSAKSYIILALLICSIPGIILEKNNMNLTYLPLLLLLPTGLNGLFKFWYKLFPINPYARVSGLILITILVAAMSVAGIEHYAYSYHYNPAIVNNFSDDLAIMPKSPSTIVVDKTEFDFYSSISHYNKKLTVREKPLTTDDLLLATNLSKNSINEKQFQITNIITNSRMNNSDRFYIYKRINKV